MKHFDYNLVTSFSYEQLFQTMRELKLTYSDAEQLFRRMVFNVVARNCDDHTKNFAFRLKKDGKWELAPGYDMCHAYQPKHQWVSQHALSINGKRSNITKEDLIVIGKSIKNKKAAATIDEISDTVSKWKTFADEVKVLPKLRDEINDTLIRL
jgi:serine/threonine-protein kinase HipA